MAYTLGRSELCRFVGVILLLLSYPTRSDAQLPLEPRETPDYCIKCTIQIERQEWNRGADAVVVGKIENCTEEPLELELVPELYLSSKTSNALGDIFWAPVDLFHDAPLATDRKPTDKKSLAKDGKEERECPNGRARPPRSGDCD